MEGQLLGRLASAFACTSQIYKLEIDLNGQPWELNFDSAPIANIVHFSLRNVSRVDGNIYAGVFNKSSATLKTFKIENSPETGKNVVKSGAFSNLPALERIDLGIF